MLVVVDAADGVVAGAMDNEYHKLGVKINTPGGIPGET